MDGPAIEDLKAKVIGLAVAGAIIIGGCAVSQAGEIPLINTQSVCEEKLTLVSLPNDGLKPSFMTFCQEMERISSTKLGSSGAEFRTRLLIAASWPAADSDMKR